MSESCLRRSSWCLMAALCWAIVPVLGRGGSSSFALGYVALVGCGLVTMLAAAAAFDAGSEGAHQDGWAPALTLGIGLSLLPWAALAYWLVVATHHRPLGAATFAVLALAIAAALVVLARRVFALSASGSRLGRRLLGAGRVLAALELAGLVVAAGASASDHAVLRALWPELVVGIALALAVVKLPLPRRLATSARWSLPLCATLCLAALWLVRSDESVRATVKSAPIIAGVFGLTVP